jgi:hypothetical protein
VKSLSLIDLGAVTLISREMKNILDRITGFEFVD